MSLADRLVVGAMRYPRRIFLVLTAIVLLAGWQLPSIQVDTDPENMLPHDQPDRLFHDRMKQRFALYDLIVVGVVNEQHPAGIYNSQTLAQLHTLSASIAEMAGVVRQEQMALDRVDNIRQQPGGGIRFDWLMKQPPADQAGAGEVRRAVERLPLLQNTLVSGDGRAAALYVPIVDKSESYRLANEIQAVIDTLDPADQYHIAGLPVAEDTFGVEMFVQMAISAPLAGLMIFLLMWLFFRSMLLVGAAMIVALVSVIVTMGLLIGQGYTVHIMSSMIPIFLMPIAVVDSVHILSEFADRYRPGEEPKAALRTVMAHLFTPMLYTSLTSAVGFASLAFTPIPPVQVFGLHVAFGILLAFLLTVLFVPAYIASLSPARLARLKDHRIDENTQGLLARLLSATGRFALLRAKGLLILFAALAALSLYGVSQIQINDNPVRWFKQDHRLRVADRVMNEHFAGIYDAFLVLEKASDGSGTEALDRRLDQLAQQYGLQQPLAAIRNATETNELQSYGNALIVAFDEASFSGSAEDEAGWLALIDTVEQAQMQARYFLDPEALGYLDRLQAYLDANDRVGKSNALPTLVKTVYRELQGGADEQYRLPASQQAVAQTLLSFQSSHRPTDLWHMVTPDYRSAAIWLQLKSGDNRDMSAVIEQVDAYLATHPLPPGVSANWAGLTYINVVWQEQMVSGMLASLLSAFVAVLLMMILLFRSLTLGLLSMLPLSVTILFIYGLIGWVGKDYDMPIAVLSALTLGLSVDFAIHYLERARAIFRRSGEWPATVAELYQGPSRAISRNAVVIAIGFTPLLLAPLVPYITVGFFLATIMAVSALVTLLLLPAVIGLIKGKQRLFGVREEIENV
ncbi:efflux RND transporter permease subunit [Marinobacterium arenosum]|uniref:efflux RND transporter permease subunit n=1 Tax=Marinobacterium arenosum TaxID=2862496 RepID=UPI001C9607E8|nr:MMPL family transporter [Marinobacterium arenosum]MBY4675479.1 MMPL family transporter [Marinobacterium arenosum]